MKGAIAVPLVITIKKPNNSKTMMIGMSQYFFLTFMNVQISFRKSIHHLSCIH